MSFLKTAGKLFLYLLAFGILHQYAHPFVAYGMIVIIIGWKLYAALIRYLYSKR